MDDGMVVAWGPAHAGGDARDVAGVPPADSVTASRRAFAVLRSDGSVSAWGQGVGCMQHHESVGHILPADYPFAAVRGRAARPLQQQGQPGQGAGQQGQPRTNQGQPQLLPIDDRADQQGQRGPLIPLGVIQIAATDGAFAAVMRNGSPPPHVAAAAVRRCVGVPATWAPAQTAAQAPIVYANDAAFAAVRADGTVA
eukprot:gene49081-4614_t